ncbi:MAG: TonB-dependent receptor [Saprospiraceae bacterium]|nr:TonB-dependent receptor [Saprospiraceae bacterium]
MRIYVQKLSAATLFFFLFAASSFAQQFISGKVTVKGTKEPIVGANVYVKENNNNTVSDNEGNFYLRVPSGECTIVASFTGFTSQTIKFNGSTTSINIELEQGVELENITVIGSRNETRTKLETPVPVDVIPVSSVLQQVGQLDVNQFLQFVAPSFNASRQSGADGADHIDPASLRGLGPDQTLVLINGKRRHQSSLLNIFGTRGRGNTGTDMNAIPTAAIERIEILRDGASAQYGSDAIAGVINIVLKSNNEGNMTNLNTSVYQRNAKKYIDSDNGNFDGTMYQVNTNYGFKIGNEGYVNVTAEFTSRDKTNRAIADSALYRNNFGDGSMKGFTSFFNSRIPTKSGFDFYAFGGYSYRGTDAYAWDRDADSERNVKAIYPNGFTPHIQSSIFDRSLSAGVKGKLKNLDVDFNNTYGSNLFHYYVDKTLNASLLAESPTRFDAGGFGASQNTTSLNFSRSYPSVLSGANLAFGAEYRVENYHIFSGEEGSYRNYGVIDTVINNKVVQFNKLNRPSGSQGFPGFRPENELNEFRSNLGLYIDSEFDITPEFLVSGALRYENYSDFGNTLNYKIASRYKVNPKILVRAAASTGFRAPSLAQIYFNSTITNFISGVPFDQILAKNNSPITRKLGIPTLNQERSQHLSVGFTARPIDGLNISVDAYQVKVKDRAVLTGVFYDSDPDIGADLKALGVSAAQFFTNAVNTTTIGLDAITTYSTQVGDGKLLVSLAGNFNKMSEIKESDIKTSPKLKGKESTYFGNREKLFMYASAPPRKINLTTDYRIGKFNANLRFVHFGEIELEDFVGQIDKYDAATITDLTLGYQLPKGVNIFLGSSNIFDVYPGYKSGGQRMYQDRETETGGTFDAVQMGSNGRMFFAKLVFKY